MILFKKKSKDLFTIKSNIKNNNSTAINTNTAQTKIFDAVSENRSQAASSTDEETLESYSCANYGYFIAPIPRKTEEFTPPKSVYDGVPKRIATYGGRSKAKIVPWKRGSRSKSSPYMSKTSLHKLSPALRNSDQLQGSAWNKPTPCVFQCSVARESKKDNTLPSIIEVNTSLSSSSDSSPLPVVISPAYKFVPIGCSSEEADDDVDYTSFSSADYDICQSQSDLEFDIFASDMKESLEPTICVESKEAKAYEIRAIRSEPISTMNDMDDNIDLTPFEMDQKSRSSLSNDDISEKFSVVSLHAEPTRKSLSIEDCNKKKESTQYEHHSSMLFLWEQVASIMNCGMQSTI